MAASRRRDFTIDDAFEESEEDRIRLYRKTSENSPLQLVLHEEDEEEEENYTGSPVSPGDVFVQLNSHNNGGSSSRLERPIIKTAGMGPSFKALAAKEDTTSLDSTSLIQGGPGPESSRGAGAGSKGWWWRHPRVRQNWKMVIAATCLVLLGLLLILTGTIAYLLPSLEGVQGFIFFIAGFICLLPGGYHLVYVYLAVKGWRGFDFSHLPLFD